MLDDILDLFNRRKRQHQAEPAPNGRKSSLPFDLPFLDDGDDDDERDRFHHEDDRRSQRRRSPSRSSQDSDWF